MYVTTACGNILFFRPCWADLTFTLDPQLALWAAFFRRFAAAFPFRVFAWALEILTRRLKPTLILHRLSARLKPCPDTRRFRLGAFTESLHAVPRYESSRSWKSPLLAQRAREKWGTRHPDDWSRVLT